VIGTPVTLLASHGMLIAILVVCVTTELALQGA